MPQPRNRLVTREDEAVEFRLVPGQESEWAGPTYYPRSALWNALGVFPVGALLVLLLMMMGISI